MRISAKAEKIASNVFNRLIAAGWVKVPPGFKVVPITPTPEQLIAGAHCVNLHDRYIAMVAAAPTVFDVKAG